jgi:hypothetical protein
MTVVMTPLAMPRDHIIVTSSSNNTFTWDYTATKRGWGGIVIQAQPGSGTDFIYPPLVSAHNLAELNLTDEDLGDNMRIVSMAFEIQDMTAELYQQGMLTAYRQNQFQSSSTAMCGISTSNNPANEQTTMRGDGVYLKLPPVSVENALLMPDTKQWKVKEGAYVVADFNSDEIPMEQPQFKFTILKPDITDISMDSHDNTDQFQISIEDNDIGVMHQVPNLLTTLNYDRPPPPQRVLPINQSGVFLAGLNPLATINVSAIWYVECAPGSEDQELLSLCSQSPAYDPIALKVVGALRRDNPIAVKYRENYTGQWFFDGIKSVVEKALPWLDNAQVIGRQAIKWIDTASTNDGYINPQSFVKGPVAKKVSAEKNPTRKKGVIPKAPGPAPKKIAFKPAARKLPRTKVNDSAEDRRRQKRARRAKIARGRYV